MAQTLLHSCFVEKYMMRAYQWENVWPAPLFKSLQQQGISLLQHLNFHWNLNCPHYKSGTQIGNKVLWKYGTNISACICLLWHRLTHKQSFKQNDEKTKCNDFKKPKRCLHWQSFASNWIETLKVVQGGE